MVREGWWWWSRQVEGRGEKVVTGLRKGDVVEKLRDWVLGRVERTRRGGTKDLGRTLEIGPRGMLGRSFLRCEVC